MSDIQQLLQQIKESSENISIGMKPLIENLLLTLVKKEQIGSANPKVSDLLDKAIKEEKQAIIDYINSIK